MVSFINLYIDLWFDCKNSVSFAWWLKLCEQEGGSWVYGYLCVHMCVCVCVHMCVCVYSLGRVYHMTQIVGKCVCMFDVWVCVCVRVCVCVWCKYVLCVYLSVSLSPPHPTPNLSVHILCFCLIIVSWWTCSVLAAGTPQWGLAPGRIRTERATQTETGCPHHPSSETLPPSASFHSQVSHQLHPCFRTSGLAVKLVWNLTIQLFVDMCRVHCFVGSFMLF